MVFNFRQLVWSDTGAEEGDSVLIEAATRAEAAKDRRFQGWDAVSPALCESCTAPLIVGEDKVCAECALTEAQGVALLAMATYGAFEFRTEADVPVIASLEKLGFVKWAGGMSGETVPELTAAGKDALRAWLDAGTRDELIASGVLEAVT